MEEWSFFCNRIIKSEHTTICHFFSFWSTFLSMHFTLCTLLLSFGLWGTSEPSWKEYAEEGDYGRAIELLNQEIARDKTSHSSDLFVELACLYMKDQKEEEAFSTFLEALEGPPSESYEMCQEEEEIYSKSLKLYLEEAQRPSQEIAKELEGLLEPIVEAHPTYAHVRFILANAYANVGKWDLFFRHFYTSYKQKRDAFLAARTMGILNIKLFEKARTLEAKEEKRKKINEALQRALCLYNEDGSLYKLLIVFSPPDARKQVAREMIERIIQGNAVIVRSQIPFFVHEALELGSKELAARFLDRAASWYQYSRVIEEMRKVVQDDKICDAG
jgi:tetratricopeptide (TPR) repeat protein